MKSSRVPSLAAALVLCSAGAAHAGGWTPPGMRPSRESLSTVIAARRAAGNPAAASTQRRETYTVVAGASHFTTEAVVREPDFRLRTVLDGSVYESGRRGGMRWRRTPSGLVRIVEADVQGDDVDRWPESIFGFAAAACAVAGETAEPHGSWVLACRAPHDAPHWFYVDKAGGDITREIVRDGVRVVTFTFADFRTEHGMRRPYRWHLSGAGGPADVFVETIAPASVDDADVAGPPSVTALFRWRGAGATPIPARFRANEIVVDVTVDGRPARFLLDTGTTQIIVGHAFARRIGLHEAFGHVVAAGVAAGDASMRAVPMLAANLEGFGIDGLLGYDFFVGHVVHIDYANERVDLIPREGFAAPSGARMMAAATCEGLPLIAARVGDVDGARFALDTGSQTLVLGRRLLEAAHRTSADLGLRERGAHRTEPYLEGPVTVEPAVAASVRLGPLVVRDALVELEVAAGPNDLELPVDGIVGTSIMARFEWWFDADGDRVWLRPR